MSIFGGNFLTEYIEDKARVRQHARRLKAGAHLVMSDSGDTSFARDLKQDSPDTTVIFRPYHANDHRWHEFQSAEQIWEAHRPYAVDGLVVQVWNEPSGYVPLTPLVTKAAAVARFARQENKRVALVNFGVGHPDTARLLAGELDPLLLELAADTRALPNLYSVHEYAQTSMLSEPYRIGRVRETLARAARIGAPLSPRRVVMTEWGRDVGGAPDTDGWKTAFDYSETRYFDFLKPGAALYRALGFLGACVFCYGSTWFSFDVQRAYHLWDLMEAWNEEHPMTQPTIEAPTTGGVLSHLSAIPGTWVNVRAQPDSAQDVGDLAKGDVVNLFTSSDPRASGWVYIVPVNAPQALAGWVSLQGGKVAFTPVPPPTPAVTLPKAEVEAIIVNLENAVALLRGTLLPETTF